MNSTGSANQASGDDSIGRMMQELRSADPETRAAAAQQLKALGVQQQAELQPSAAVRKLKGGAMFTLGTIQFLIGLAVLAIVVIRLLLMFAR